MSSSKGVNMATLNYKLKIEYETVFNIAVFFFVCYIIVSCFWGYNNYIAEDFYEVEIVDQKTYYDNGYGGMIYEIEYRHANSTEPSKRVVDIELYNEAAEKGKLTIQATKSDINAIPGWEKLAIPGYAIGCIFLIFFIAFLFTV